jgi:alpha-amylase
MDKDMRNKLTILLLLASILTSCLPASAPTASPADVTSAWWNNDVIYEIFVRSFYDSNGDGIGDFNGITEKLDYLNDGDPNTTSDLGVTGIWLMPIFPSPSYHGYDVTDYYGVNPQYGTMDEFKTLLAEAHKRGIRVIIDMVFNHTSDQHPWFKEAKKDTNSKYRDWYIWSETNPGYKGPWNESVWHSSTTGFYYGIFTANMPDLNYDNPKVTKEMDKVTTFWLKDVGVDGFRLDAAKHLIEENAKQENTASTHKWFTDFRKAYKAANPEAIMVGELSGDTPQTIASYTSGDQLDLAFNFSLAAAYINAANRGQATYVTDALSYSIKALPTGQYSPFLTNHDQDRAMSQLYGDVNKAKLAASLLLTSPGVPFIYYGEEIGMVGKKPDENIRRPMQWSGGENAGFSGGKPWRPADAGYTEVNVAAQMDDPASLLSHYRTLIAIRNAHPALRTGNVLLIPTGKSSVYALLRVDKDDKILVLINLDEKPTSEYTLDWANSDFTAGTTLTSLMGAIDSTTVSAQPVKELPPYSTYIFQIQ